MVAPYQKYKQQSLISLTPGEQLVLLFDQACLNIAKSIDFIEKKDICNAHNSIVKTENIFYSLIDNLDFNYAISKNLHSLYNFILDRLIQGNINKDVNLLREAQKIACELRETWREAERLSCRGVQNENRNKQQRNY